MSEDFEAPKDDLENGLPEGSEGHSDYKPADTKDVKAKYQLSGMYQNWFLDYASYVILERAVPHINDGLKPVQRRILHSMRRLEDGRYNKVANIVRCLCSFLSCHNCKTLLLSLCPALRTFVKTYYYVNTALLKVECMSVTL